MLKFSIIIATYNNEKYITGTIESVLNQTFKNWELIIINDASTDNTTDKIEPFLNDKRIKLINNEKQLGIGKSRHKGTKYITSDFFGDLDGDDILHPEAIEIMHDAHIRYPKASMIYSQFMYCDKNMKHVRKGMCNHISKKKTNLEANKVSHFRTYKLNYYNKTDGFHTKLKSAIDKDISYKMEEVGDLVYIDKVLYYYRKHKQGISQGKERRAIAKQNMAIAQKEARERRRK